ncbi:MAG: primase C-terminal domain-containing protein [Candidatus Scalinduaceae bacterium]
MGKFNLVDFAAQYQRGFRNNVVHIYEVPELMKRYKYFECYSTFFLYSHDILKYMRENIVGGHPSISGYEGKIGATYFPMDIDSPDLNLALEVTKKMVSFLTEKWGIQKEALLVYFSGHKGFHIMLDIRVFGRVRPSKYLHLIFSRMRHNLVKQLKIVDVSAFDMTIKDRVRLLRLPNTINKKSRLYKVQIILEDINHLSLTDILSFARTPRPLSYVDETGIISNVRLIKENPYAVKCYKNAKYLVRRSIRKEFEYRFTLRDDDPEKVLCPAMVNIWKSHIDVGYRNNCAIRLASQFRLSGFSKEKTEELILSWNKRNRIGLYKEEVRRTVHSAYVHRFPYRYGFRDEIIRRFCPFKNINDCECYQRFIARKE